jgi:hypothetical protein
MSIIGVERTQGGVAIRAHPLKITEICCPPRRMAMRTNRHKPGNMAVLVNTPCQGLRNFEDVVEAQGT